MVGSCFTFLINKQLIDVFTCSSKSSHEGKPVFVNL